METQELKQQDLREGAVTKTIEHQTAKIPSIAFLALAGLAVAGSVALSMRKDKGLANFVGLWVPSFLLLGIYNKLVKVHGSDVEEAQKLH